MKYVEEGPKKQGCSLQDKSRVYMRGRQGEAALRREGVCGTIASEKLCTEDVPPS